MMNATLHTDVFRWRSYGIWNENFIFKLRQRSCEDDIFMKDNEKWFMIIITIILEVERFVVNESY